MKWCAVVTQGLRVTPMKEAHAGSYAAGVYNHWTGLVNWTGGLTIKIIFMLLMKLTCL